MALYIRYHVVVYFFSPSVVPLDGLGFRITTLTMPYDDYGTYAFCSLMSLSLLCDILILCMYMYNSISIQRGIPYYLLYSVRSRYCRLRFLLEGRRHGTSRTGG